MPDFKNWVNHVLFGKQTKVNHNVYNIFIFSHKSASCLLKLILKSRLLLHEQLSQGSSVTKEGGGNNVEIAEIT